MAYGSRTVTVSDDGIRGSMALDWTSDGYLVLTITADRTMRAIISIADAERMSKGLQQAAEIARRIKATPSGCLSAHGQA
jgi:hypothetical protein